MKPWMTVALLVLTAASLPKTQSFQCAHHLHCPQTQCCLGFDFMNLFSFSGRPGNCYDFKREGDSCHYFEFLECGCYPGLSCLPADGSPEEYNDVERVCTNTSMPYVRPDSEARCNQDEDCPVADECCYIDRFTGTASWGVLDDGRQGSCRKYTQEGGHCTSLYPCGCAPGLECVVASEGTRNDRVCVNLTAGV